MRKHLDSQIIEYNTLDDFFRENNSYRGQLILIARSLKIQNEDSEPKYFNLTYFEREKGNRRKIVGYCCKGTTESILRIIRSKVYMPCTKIISANYLPKDKKDLYCKEHEI